MRTFPPFFPRVRRGYVLMVTMVFLAVSLISLASVMWWASSNGKVTQQNELFTTAEAAADAAAEQVVANLDWDWDSSQVLQPASHYANLPLPDQTAWPMKFQFSDGSGHAGVVGVNLVVSNFFAPVGSEFAGLQGYIYPCTVTSVATTSNQLYTVSTTVQETVNATIIPLFQFFIFYNVNLEIDPGAAMVGKGPVFSNQGIWSGTANVTYNSTVAAAGKVYYTNAADPWVSGKTDTGTPIGNFAIKPMSSNDSLTLPIGNSTNNSPSAVEAIINLVTNGMGAPNALAYTTNGQAYYFNASDLIVSNSASGLASTNGILGTNITIWFQDPNNSASYLTPVTKDYYSLIAGPIHGTNVIANTNGFDSATNVLYAAYSFVTNVSYYDYRESNTVQAVQIDVSLLNKWITNTATTGGNSVNTTSFNDNDHGIRSIYVYNNVRKTSSQLPAVRMVRGAQLPSTSNGSTTTSGLAVTTPQPLYVEGNYNVQTATSSANASAGTTNTAYTYPAALVGDAITVLSTNWSDSYTSGTAIGSRNIPSATTINAATLEGIVQSTNSNYSGGVENFLRLEEDWGNNGSSTKIVLTYNGSISVMFPSQYATNFWPGTGSVYNPPTRNWAFDLNFTDPSKLPPLTPKVYRLIRATWKVY